MPASEIAPKLEPAVRPAKESRAVDISTILLVVAVATLVVLRNYYLFLGAPRLIWNSLIHDRNAHYEFASELVLAIRHIQPFRFFTIFLNQSKVWPPLYGLLTMLLMLPGGPNYRLAVIPSAVGWWLTAVFAFLTARRISPAGGNAAGLIASALVLASPALREYGADIMLESLGAGLTMAALYFYAVAEQEDSIAIWRGLAIVLTALFFEKYNYWLMVVVPLGLDQFVRHRASIVASIRKVLEQIDRATVAREAKQPLGRLALAILALIIIVWIRGPSPLMLGHIRVSIYPPGNIITALYVVVAIRLALAWRNEFHGQSPRAVLLRWHLAPCAVSLMLPGRLYPFLWYLSPANNDVNTSSPFEFYFDVVTNELHSIPRVSLIVAVAVLVAIVGWRRLRMGGTGVLLFVALSAIAVCLHPNQKDRFMYSWFAAVWVAAAAGLMLAIYGIAGAPRNRAARIFSWSVAIASFAILLNYALALTPTPSHLSNLDISDAYLPALSGSKRVVFLSNLQMQSFVDWTYLERYRRLGVVEWPLKGSDATPEVAAQTFSQLAASRDPDEVIVFVDVPPRSPDYVPLSDYSPWATMLRAARSDPDLRLVRTWDIPGHDAEVTMWQPAISVEK
jgi:hypothetical protein